MKWKSFSPEIQTIPEFEHSGGSDPRLRISLPDWKGIGIWEKDFPFPEGAAACRVSVDSDALAKLGNKVGALACFRKNDGSFSSMDYLEPTVKKDGTLCFSSVFKRDPDITSVTFKLYFKWAAGTVVFHGARVESCEAPPDRFVKIVTTRLTPLEKETPEQRRARIVLLLERIEKEVVAPDLILFSEGIPDIGMNLPYSVSAETVPGPTSLLFSEWAKRLNCHIAGGIHEQLEGNFYNTALILDRKGRLAGKYHKVHLTWNESSGGIIPGDTFPVFALDFGRVGIAICWDNWFGESARMLRLNGAELMLVPIAGDGIPEHRDHVWPARAAEQGMAAAFSACYPSEDGICASRIFNPLGALVAQATKNDSFAEGTVNLAERLRTLYLSVPCHGEGRSLYVRERRNGIYQRLDLP